MEAGQSRMAPLLDSSPDVSQHGAITFTSTLCSSAEKPPPTPQRDWVRATPPPRTLLVTPRQRPRVSDHLPEPADSPLKQMQRSTPFEEQENDRRLSHQNASPSHYQYGYPQLRSFRQNSLLRGSWQPSMTPSFQGSPERWTSSRIAASNTAYLSTTAASPLRTADANQGPRVPLSGIQTPMLQEWGGKSGAASPRASASQKWGAEQRDPKRDERTNLQPTPSLAKSPKRVETKSAAVASFGDMLFNRFAPPWLRDSSLVHEKVILAGKKGRREFAYAAVTSKELVLVTLTKRGTTIREMLNVLDIASIDHFKNKPLPPVRQALWRRVLQPCTPPCICHLAVAPIDDEAEQDEQQVAGLAVTIGADSKPLEIFTGPSSRLQFVLQSVCYNALVDQCRAGEPIVAPPNEPHDESAMKSLFSELKSELLVAHSIPDKLKLFEEIGTAGERSVPIKKLFFESGVFSRLLDEMRLTKLKQKVMVELHSSDGPQNASTAVRTSGQKWSGNKIREPGTPKHTTPEGMTPRRTVLSVRNSMSTPLGGRISGDLTPSTPKLEGVYKFAQGAPSFRGANVYGSSTPWKIKDEEMDTNGGGRPLNSDAGGRGGDSGGARTLRAPSVRECAAAIEGLQYVVTLLECLTRMLLKSEAIAARQSLLTPPRHYSFHSMLATLMEDFATPPGLQGAQRQAARQLAKQILDLQASVLFSLLSISDQAALSNSKYSRDYLLYYVIRVPGFNEKKLSLLFRRLVELLYSERNPKTGSYKAGAAVMVSIYQAATLLSWICERSSSARAILTATCSEDIKYRLGNPQIFGQLDLRCRINERSRELVSRLLRALVSGVERS